MSSFAFAEGSITNQLSVFAPIHPMHSSVHPKLIARAQLPMLSQEKYVAFGRQKTGVDIVQDGPQLTRPLQLHCYIFFSYRYYSEGKCKVNPTSKI